jgi:hypothetical protein
LSLPLSPSASCSEYAKELCNHQKVFRYIFMLYFIIRCSNFRFFELIFFKFMHLLNRSKILVSYLPQKLLHINVIGVLLNFIVEQFLLNISLVRSLNIQRAISDLDCLYREIQVHNNRNHPSFVHFKSLNTKYLALWVQVCKNSQFS